MIKEYLPKIKKIIWAGFLVSLPVTNFPYFPAGLGGSKVSVRPLLLYPLVLLTLVILPTLWKRKLPRVWLPFFVFVILALISSGLPILQGVTSELSEVTVISRIVRTLVTLFLAAAIYLIVSLVPLDEEDLQFTLKWLYIGLILALFWGTLQIIYVLDLVPNWYKIMRKIQRYISINKGIPDRIIGLTQEPSWFADQLSALWLPWIFSAVLMNKTVFKRSWGWITVEKILLVWMAVVLVFTLSRAGLVVAAVVVASGIVFFRPKRDPSTQSKQRSGIFGKIQYRYNNLPRFIRTIIPALGILGVLVGLFYFASLESKYISRMWNYWVGNSSEFQAIGSKSLRRYIRYIGFGPRFIYWETAYRIYAQNPFFGVGLGNYTFHFQDTFPAVQIGYMPELLKAMVPDHSRVITAKNYFARLLAETGLLGTAAFVTFLVVLAGSAVYLWLSKNSKVKYWGAGGLLALIAFCVDTLSYDSMAIPNPWIVFGLITASFSVFTKSSHQKEERQH
ncbi:MAG: O-antigen ligase family protein [Anaerolineales bacterium]|nr:O-antigen ligase family protein [Anaerolineales bacterium]